MPPKTDLSSRFKQLTRLAQKALIKASSSIVNDGLQKNDPCIWMVCISNIDSANEALKKLETEQFGKRCPLQTGVLSLTLAVIQQILKGITTLKEPSVELIALQCKLFCSVGGLIKLILSTGLLQPHRSDWKAWLLEEGTGLHSMFHFIVVLKSRINAHLIDSNGMMCSAASSSTILSVTDMSPGSLLPFQLVQCTYLAFQIATALYLAMGSSPQLPHHINSHAIIYKLLGSDTCIEAIKLLYAALKKSRDEKVLFSLNKEVFFALSRSHSLIFLLEKVMSTQRRRHYVTQSSDCVVDKLYKSLVSCWPSINRWLIVALSVLEEERKNHVGDERAGSSRRSNDCQVQIQDEYLIEGIKAMLKVLTVASPEVRNKYHIQMYSFALSIVEACLLSSSSSTCWSTDLMKGKPLEMRLTLKREALDLAQETFKTMPNPQALSSHIQLPLRQRQVLELFLFMETTLRGLCRRYQAVSTVYLANQTILSEAPHRGSDTAYMQELCQSQNQELAEIAIAVSGIGEALHNMVAVAGPWIKDAEEPRGGPAGNDVSTADYGHSYTVHYGHDASSSVTICHDNRVHACAAQRRRCSTTTAASVHLHISLILTLCKAMRVFTECKHSQVQLNLASAVRQAYNHITTILQPRKHEGGQQEKVKRLLALQVVDCTFQPVLHTCRTEPIAHCTNMIQDFLSHISTCMYIAGKEDSPTELAVLSSSVMSSYIRQLMFWADQKTPSLKAMSAVAASTAALGPGVTSEYCEQALVCKVLVSFFCITTGRLRKATESMLVSAHEEKHARSGDVLIGEVEAARRDLLDPACRCLLHLLDSSWLEALARMSHLPLRLSESSAQNLAEVGAADLGLGPAAHYRMTEGGYIPLGVHFTSGLHHLSAALCNLLDTKGSGVRMPELGALSSHPTGCVSSSYRPNKLGGSIVDDALLSLSAHFRRTLLEGLQKSWIKYMECALDGSWSNACWEEAAWGEVGKMMAREVSQQQGEEVSMIRRMAAVLWQDESQQDFLLIMKHDMGSSRPTAAAAAGASAAAGSASYVSNTAVGMGSSATSASAGAINDCCNKQALNEWTVPWEEVRSQLWSSGTSKDLKDLNLVSELLCCQNAACGNMLGEGELKIKTFVCCRYARYCSRECQSEDWRAGHRHVCRASSSALNHSTAAIDSSLSS